MLAAVWPGHRPLSLVAGDRIRTCDLWVVSQVMGHLRRPVRCISPAQLISRVRRVLSCCTAMGQFRRVLFPKAFPIAVHALAVGGCRWRPMPRVFPSRGTGPRAVAGPGWLLAWLVASQRNRSAAGALLARAWMMSVAVPPYLPSRATDDGLVDRSGSAFAMWTAVPCLHRVLTGLGRDSIEMCEVSPMGGLLPDEERTQALQAAT
jgi:hypothetical protein